MLPALVTTSATVVIVTQCTSFTSICKGVVAIGKPIIAITFATAAIPIIATLVPAKTAIILVVKEIRLTPISIIIIAICPTGVALLNSTFTIIAKGFAIIDQTDIRTFAAIIYILHNIRFTAVIFVAITILIVVSTITITVLANGIIRAVVYISPFETSIIVLIYAILPSRLGFAHSGPIFAFVYTSIYIIVNFIIRQLSVLLSRGILRFIDVYIIRATFIGITFIVLRIYILARTRVNSYTLQSLSLITLLAYAGGLLIIDNTYTVPVAIYSLTGIGFLLDLWIATSRYHQQPEIKNH